MEYKDYYATLGVAKDASKEQIQKAYRKLARKYHPDVNQDPGAEAKFKEIAEAYEVLKDPEKRRKYERFGSAWKQAQTTGAPPPGFEEVFSRFGFGGPGGGFRGHTVEFDLGGGGSPFSSFFEMLFGSEPATRGRRPRGTEGPSAPRSRAGAHAEARIGLSLEEAARGGRREITLTDPETGKARTLAVTIPKGVKRGQRLRLSGQGGEGAGGAPRGDLYLTVEIAPHPRFRLEGSDLHTPLPVSPWEAALGGQAEVPTLDGTVKVRIPPGSQSGQRIRLKGRGFPNSKGAPGDLYAELKIVVPPKLSQREKELFEELAEASSFRPRG